MTESSSSDSTVWDRIRDQLRLLRAQQESRHSDPARQAEKLARRARAFRERIQQSQDSSPNTPIIFFKSQRVRYGLSLDAVFEIQPLDSFSLIPRGPEFLYGVVHFRGAILALFNLAGLLGSSQAGIADIHVYLVAQGAGHRIAIGAEDVEGLEAISISEIKSAPEWGGHIPHHWIRGVYGDDCLILDLDAILSDPAILHWYRGTSASGPQP